jgi:hypothetical protein
MDRIKNIWRENSGLVVIGLAILAVLSGQLPERSAGAESTTAQESIQSEVVDEEIAVSMRDGECGSERNFGHIMPCTREE